MKTRKSKIKITARLLSFALSLLLIFYAIPLSSYGYNEEPEKSVDYNEFMDYEVKELREETAKVFRLADGSYEAVSYPFSVHYKNGDTWEEIDNTLSLVSSDGFFASDRFETESNYRISFARNLSENDYLRLTVGQHKISFSLLNAENKGFSVKNPEKVDRFGKTWQELAKLPLETTTVTYREAFENTDIEYVLSGNNITENIILNKKVECPEYTFRIDAKGLTLSLDKSGNVLFAEAETGAALFCIPTSFMTDAKGNFSSEVKYQLKESDGAWLLSILPSKEWLSDPTRAYPVTIDPPISYVAQTLSSTASNFCWYYDDNEGEYAVRTTGAMTVGDDSFSCFRFSLPNALVGSIILDSHVDFSVASSGTDYCNGEIEIAMSVIPEEEILNAADPKAYVFNRYYNSWQQNYGCVASDVDMMDAKRVFFNENGVATDAVSFDVPLKTNYSVSLFVYKCGAWIPEVTLHGVGDPVGRPVVCVNYKAPVGIDSALSVIPNEFDNLPVGYVTAARGDLSLSFPSIPATEDVFSYSPIVSCHENRSFMGTNLGIFPGVFFDFQENVRRETIQNTVNSSSGYITVNTTYYIWTDPSAHEVTFVSKNDNSGAYEDTENLHLTLTQNTETDLIEIRDLQGNVHLFNSSGILTHRMNPHGTLEFCYQNENPANRKVTEIKLSADTLLSASNPINQENPGSQNQPIVLCTVEYQNNVLFALNCERNQTRMEFTWNNDDFTVLSFSKNPSQRQNTVLSNVKVMWEASHVTVEDLLYHKKTIYEKEYSRVTEVRNYVMDGNDYEECGDSFSLEYGNAKTTVRLAGADCELETSDDLFVKFIFDRTGKTETVYSYDPDGKIIELQHFEYNTDGQTTTSTTTPYLPANILVNPGFEVFGEYDLPGWTNCSDGYFALDAERRGVAFDGNGALYLASYLDFAETVYAEQAVTLSDDGDFTFSAYAKMVAETPMASNYVSLQILDANRQVIKESKHVYATDVTTDSNGTANPAILNGYQKISVKFTNGENGKYAAYVRLCASVSNDTIVWFDNASLIRGEDSAYFSLISDGSFDRESWQNPAWTFMGVYTSDDDGYRSPSTLYNQPLFLDETNRVTATVLSLTDWDADQTYTVDNYYDAEENFILGFWTKQAVGHAGSRKSQTAQVIVHVEYVEPSFMAEPDDFYQTFVFNFHAEEEWNYYAYAFGSQSGYRVKKITLEFVFGQMHSTVYLDEVSLVRDLGMSYTDYYDPQTKLLTDRVTSNGNAVHYTYNEYGLVSEIVTEDKTERYTYNNRNDVILAETEYPSGALSTTHYTRDREGRVLSNVTEVSLYGEPFDKGYYTEATYYGTEDNFGRLETRTDENGYVTRYYYYSNGDIYYFITPDNIGVMYEYDDHRRVTEEKPFIVNEYGILDFDNTVEATYNDDGRISQIKALNGEQYHFTYNVFGQLTKIEVGSVTLAEYAYADHGGHRNSVSYPNGETANYLYDALDNLVGICFNNNEECSVAYAYDDLGRLTKSFDLDNSFVTIYTYDAKGEIVSKNVYTADSENEPDQHIYSVSFIYDDDGRALSASYLVRSGNRAEKTTYAAYYNNDGTLLLNYLINEPDIINPDNGNGIHYSYDDYGRLDYSGLIFDNVEIGTEFSYELEPSENEEEPTQDDTHLISHATGMTTAVYNGRHKTVEYNYDLSYDSVGNICKMNDRVYYYDGLGQLFHAEMRSEDLIYEYVYYNNGNIWKKKQQVGNTPAGYHEDVFVYNTGAWKDQLISYNGASITYDAAGNPLSYYNGASMTWAKGKQLATLSLDGTNYAFTYDENGVRIGKQYGNVTYRYIVSGTTVLAQEKYISDVLVEQLFFYYDAFGALLGYKYVDAIGNESNYFYVKNPIGEIVALIDEDGNVAAAYTYDPFGKLLSNTASASDSGACANPYFYKDYLYDSEFGFYYLNSRYYDPEICRFINADNYVNANGDPLGYNMYAYCGNNPIMGADPTGEFLLTAWGILAIIGAAIAVAATVHDVVHLSEIESKTKKKSDEDVQIGDSYKILTPWVQFGYSFYLNHIRSDTKDVIKGSTIGIASEWAMHNIAYALHQKRESSESVDIGPTIFDDNHWPAYMLLEPGFAVVHDLIVFIRNKQRRASHESDN